MDILMVVGFTFGAKYEWSPPSQLKDRLWFDKEKTPTRDDFNRKIRFEFLISYVGVVVDIFNSCNIHIDLTNPHTRTRAFAPFLGRINPWQTCVLVAATSAGIVSWLNTSMMYIALLVFYRGESLSIALHLSMHLFMVIIRICTLIRRFWIYEFQRALCHMYVHL